MQLTDNKPCPHLHEYITHHALNQAKYLKCERVVWTSCPHPLCSAYIHSVRSPGEADESIWGAVGRCWTSPQHPRLDGNNERETRGWEKVRKILRSYRRWQEEEKAWETFYLRQPGMPPCLQKGRQAVWEEDKHEEAEWSLGLHANPAWQEISKNPTGGGPFSTSRQWNILSFYVVMMIATSHVQFKWLWGNVFFRWEPSGWVAASVHWTDGRTSSENLIPSNINFVSCTYLCLSDGAVLRNWTNPTQIWSRVCPFRSTWVAGLTWWYKMQDYVTSLVFCDAPFYSVDQYLLKKNHCSEQKCGQNWSSWAFWYF